MRSPTVLVSSSLLEDLFRLGCSCRTVYDDEISNDERDLFVGGTADSFTLFERLEAKLEEHSGIYLAKILVLHVHVTLGSIFIYK